VSKASRKHTPKTPQRQSGKARPDPSIALGLQYFAAWAAFAQADAARDEMEGRVRRKYPQAPAEICFLNSPNSNVLCPEEDILRKPEPARSALLRMLGAEERKRAKIDRETGYAAKLAEVKRLDAMADARRVLWLAEPATTVAGVVLKLRCWLYHEDPDPLGGIGERVTLSALADAERLCGIRHMAVMHGRTEFAEFAKCTRADFEGMVSP
jgi:hypothetical protein